MMRSKKQLILLSLASAVAAPSAALAQSVQADPPYLTQSGWILSRGTGFASDGVSRVYVTAQVVGIRGQAYGGSNPGDAKGIARGQGSARCPRGNGTYYTYACVWQQLPSGQWTRQFCQASPNRMIPCG